uniref:Metalloendopeptidase n=1 Tax=Setaria digitata TaxID=48799 RepID=A0A915PUJ9_9BILA
MLGEQWPAECEMETEYLVVNVSCTVRVVRYFDRRKADFETFLMPSDFAMALKLDDNWQISNDSALYNSGKFEGDLDMDIAELENISPNTNSKNPQNNVLYNAVRNRHQIWSSSQIPYAISSQYTPYSRSVIAAAMEEYATRTCVRWVPRSVKDSDYIYIVPDRGCYSMVGKTGGKQTVSLGTGCIQKGIILHELMHAVGFFHEQSRTDRDNHITVLWENIQPGMQGQFEKYDHAMIDSLSADYDYDSIMHYGPRAFSRNGQPTLMPKVPAAIGQRLHFSTLDIFKINKLYNCSSNVTQMQTVAPSLQTKVDKSLKPTKTPMHLIITDSCKNIRSDCDELVAYGEYCVTNLWMKHYCPESCETCSNFTGLNILMCWKLLRRIKPCMDQRLDCLTLVQNGHCTISNAFMQAFCSKSCGFCKSAEVIDNATVVTTKLSTIGAIITTTAETMRKPSKSKQSFEIAWRKLIGSKINPAEIFPTQKTCTDQKHFCTHWKSAGFCKGLFSSFMTENCQRSCELCIVEDKDIYLE